LNKANEPISLTEVLLGKPVAWPEKGHADVMDHIASSKAHIVYEDAHVVAFEEDDDKREDPAKPNDPRITIAPKKNVPSLMDIDLSDRPTAVHLLYAVQQVAFKLGLHKTGFEIHGNVLPPYQTKPGIRLKIRTGAPKHAPTGVGKQDAGSELFVSGVVSAGAQTQWDKPDPEHTFRGRLDGTRDHGDDEVVYQDEHVFAFRHRVDPTLPSWWAVHVVVIPKKWMPTALDFGVADIELWCKLIEGIQKCAIALDLYKDGFMIRLGVLPPYQHTEHIHIHVLSGKHNAPGEAVAAPTPPSSP
jgi:histidine triad (HIT) family protein